MTRTTNARIAGFTFLLYIAAGVTGMVLFGRAASGEGIAAKLVSIGQHATDVRVSVVLSLLTCFAALVLAVTLYGITRDEDHSLRCSRCHAVSVRECSAAFSSSRRWDCCGSGRQPEQVHQTPRQRTRWARSFLRCKAGT